MDELCSEEAVRDSVWFVSLWNHVVQIKECFALGGDSSVRGSSLQLYIFEHGVMGIVSGQSSGLLVRLNHSSWLFADIVRRRPGK